MSVVCIDFSSMLAVLCECVLLLMCVCDEVSVVCIDCASMLAVLCECVLYV